MPPELFCALVAGDVVPHLPGLRTEVAVDVIKLVKGVEDICEFNSLRPSLGEVPGLRRPNEDDWRLSGPRAQEHRLIPKLVTGDGSAWSRRRSVRRLRP